MLFAPFLFLTGGWCFKSHLSYLAVETKPPQLRNPLQRGSDLTYPFHPETHYESPSKQSWSSSWYLGSLFALQQLRVATLARSLTLYAPAWGSTGRPRRERPPFGVVCSFSGEEGRVVGGGWGRRPRSHLDLLPITLIDYSTWMKTATKCWLPILETHQGSSWH